MRFIDICKAYLRYWYIILLCIIVSLTGTYLMTYNDNNFVARSIYEIKNIDSKPISSDVYANASRSMRSIVTHTDFYNKIIEKVGEVNKDLSDKLTVNNIKENLSYDFFNNSNFIEIKYICADEDNSRLIVDISTKLAIREFEIRNEETDLNVKFDKIYSTEVIPLENNKFKKIIVGMVAGGICGFVGITIFVAFNPYVSNPELLKVETGIEIINILDKKRGTKSEQK